MGYLGIALRVFSLYLCCLSIAHAESVPKPEVEFIDDSHIILRLGESEIRVSLDEPSLYPARGMLVDWVSRSAQIVDRYYGRFPVRELNLALTAAEGAKVVSGVQYSGRPPTIVVGVGRHVATKTLRADWVMVHEMVHLALADLPQFNSWFEEGLAVYVEAVARAQAGNLSEQQAWLGLIKGMPHGRPRAGDKGLDFTDTWGRRYWGGAIFCLWADIEIHRQTENRYGLQDALQAIANSGYNSYRRTDIATVLRIGDEAVGVDVLQTHYQKMRADPFTPDLDTLWQELGIRMNGDTVELDLAAEFAAVRQSIMQRVEPGSG